MADIAAVTSGNVNADRLLVILPLFFFYLLGSISSLQKWIAVQKVSVAVKADVQEANSAQDKHDIYDNRMRWVMYSILSAILSALGYLLFGVSFFYWIFGAFAMFILTIVVFACCLILTGQSREAVHRDLNGYLHNQLKHSRHTLGYEAVGLLFGIGISIATLWYHNDIGASIAVFAVLYFVQSTGFPMRTVSMRMSIIATIVIEVLLLACLTTVFIANHSATSPDNKEKIQVQFPAKSEDFSAWISVIFLAFPPSLIIPPSLRLDFANHMVSAAPLHLMTLEEVPADTNPRLKLSRGIVIPRTIPFTFKCPYFASTLLAWLLANVAITYALVCGWLSDPDRFTYLFYVLVVAIPMVIMSVFGVSLLRGEVERMWRYEERWGLETAVERSIGSSEGIQAVDAREGSTQDVYV